MNSYLYNMNMDYVSKSTMRGLNKIYCGTNKIYCSPLVETILIMLGIDAVNIIDNNGNLGIRVLGEADRNAITGEIMPGDNRVIRLEEYNEHELNELDNVIIIDNQFFKEL